MDQILTGKEISLLVRKKLSQGKKKQCSGRNNKGLICVRHKGGGHKRIIRLIDFKKIFWGLRGVVLRFSYDPIRTAPLALICYDNGILSYHIATEGIYIGKFIYVGNLRCVPLALQKGGVDFLHLMPEGSLINSIEFAPLQGSIASRSAGTFAQLLRAQYINTHFSLVRLPSKEERLVSSSCIATIGCVSNGDHFLVRKAKAGLRRNLGVRPTVRGVAMNPIDHPHGGGQGKTSGAGGQRSQVTFKGFVAKTKPTRNKKKSLNFIMLSRKNKYLKK